MSRVCVDRSGRVQCVAELGLPLPASVAWGQLRDFRRSATHDYFHAAVQVPGGAPRAGAGLVLEHRFLLLRVRRVGRILRWREWGEAVGIEPPKAVAGFSFSDLSTAGPRAGFPHVFSYDLTAAGSNACRLRVIVRGLWTATAVPRWAARLWLGWVFRHVVRSVQNDLLITAAQWRASGRLRGRDRQTPRQADR
jgi:hypothetical protein